MRRATRGWISTATIGPRCILVGIPSQAKFAETPALRYATELATGCKASLSVCVFPPTVQQEGAGASAGKDEQGPQLASLTLHGASRYISQAGVDLVAEHSPSEPGSRFVQLARVHDLTVLDAARPAAWAEPQLKTPFSTQVAPCSWCHRAAAGRRRGVSQLPGTAAPAPHGPSTML